MILHTEIQGTGAQPVLLLHGFLGSGRNLASLGKNLAEARPNTTVYRLDLPGHGLSPSLPAQTSLWDMADMVLKHLQTLGHTCPWRVVGHSLGGRVALAMTHVQPSWASHVVFLDISPSAIGVGPMGLRDPGSDIEKVAHVLLQAPECAPHRSVFKDFFVQQGLSSSLADWLLTNLMATSNGYQWRFNRASLLDFHQRSKNTDLWDTFQHTHVRFQCIKGGLSHFVTSQDATRMQNLGCQVDTVPHAGHFIHTDALKDVCRLVLW